MYGKLLFAVGIGAGYLLGTNRGRKDYDMLKRRVSEVWLNPNVQKVAKQATDFAEKNIPMGESVTDAVGAATKSARANVGTTGSGSSGSGSQSSGSSAGGSSSGDSSSGGTSSASPGA
jgi:uncharacterized membrane protein YgcG